LQRAIDLFAGCGGLSQGLKQAGFSVVGAVEIDPVAARAYQLNHRETEFWQQDISTLKASSILKTLGLKKGELDLLAGCPPCQGFSKVRTLNGKKTIEDERNDLVFEFLRLAKALRPKAIMMENVPGLAEDYRIEKYSRSLRAMGYNVDFQVLNAADYGVPQRRHRLILLAGLDGPIPFAQKARKKKTVRDAIGSLPLPGECRDPIHDLKENRSEKIKKLIQMIPKNGGSRTDLPKRYQLECHKRCNGFKDIYGRMAWDKVAPTLTTGCFNPSKGRFLHPDQDRGITMREAALLQSFPKSYKFPPDLGKTTLALQIGNALPPEFIRRHALSIKKYLSLVD